MKKRISVLFLVFVLALGCFTGCSCSSGNASKLPDVSIFGDPITNTDIKINESGYSIIDGAVVCGIIIENTSQKEAYAYPTVVTTLYDENGGVIEEDSEVLISIEPGEVQACSSFVPFGDKKPAKVEFSVQANSTKQPSANATVSSDLEISNVNIINGNYGPAFSGTIKNNSNNDITMGQVTVIYRQDDNIVGGASVSIYDIGAGKEAPFEINLSSGINYNNYEISAISFY